MFWYIYVVCMNQQLATLHFKTIHLNVLWLAQEVTCFHNRTLLL